jgi:hypothetical protein
MMKKVILCTVVSLFVFCGFVAGPWGLDLAEALTDQEMKSLTAPGVEAIIIISNGHQIQLIPGEGISFRTPKDKAGKHGKENRRPTPKIKNTVPKELKYEIPKGNFKHSSIEVYGENTCILWGGIYYCW